MRILKAVPVMGSTFNAIDKLRALDREVQQTSSDEGRGSCATFCQLIFHGDGAAPTITGRLYTGDAAKFLRDALIEANNMQGLAYKASDDLRNQIADKV